MAKPYLTIEQQISILKEKNLNIKDDFLSFKSNLTRTIDRYCKKNFRLSKETLLSQMGMPSNWKNITRYKP